MTKELNFFNNRFSIRVAVKFARAHKIALGDKIARVHKIARIYFCKKTLLHEVIKLH